MSVTHVYKEWLIFQSLTYMAKCDSYFPVWLILPSATILMSVTLVNHSPKFNPFGQMWPILPSVTRALKWDNFDECDPCL